MIAHSLPKSTINTVCNVTVELGFAASTYHGWDLTSLVPLPADRADFTVLQVRLDRPIRGSWVLM